MDVTNIATLIIKILTLVGVGIYIIFAFVIVRQERLMSAVIEEGFEPVLKTLAFFHLLASFFVFFMALVLL